MATPDLEERVSKFRCDAAERFLPDGEYTRLKESLKGFGNSDIATAVVYAFDKRTQVGPFSLIANNTIPAGPVAVGSSLHDAGFTNTRVVLQQWNPNFRPSEARLNGKTLDMLLVSSMKIHSASAYRLIRDALGMGDERPLIIAGGAKAHFEPDMYDFFNTSKSPDVVVTGEEYVLLELLERIREYQQENETMLGAFKRLAESRFLDDIKGLVYKWKDPYTRQDYLINTGSQQFVKRLDELPFMTVGLRLVEPPGKGKGLLGSPLKPDEIKRYVDIITMSDIIGCLGDCNFCPLPDYYLRTVRMKSPERLVDEVAAVVELTGIQALFGTNDDFFLSPKWLNKVLQLMSEKRLGDGGRLADVVSYYAEARVDSVYKNLDLVQMLKKAGVTALWLGVEDLSKTLVDKGQDHTEEVFSELATNKVSICSMVMHHDGLGYSGRMGLKEQLSLLKRWGSKYLLLSYLIPAPGSKLFEGHFEKGEVFKRIGMINVGDRHYTGIFVVSSAHENPAQKQWEVAKGYLDFYGTSYSRLASILLRRLISSRGSQEPPEGYLDRAYVNNAFGTSFKNLVPWLINMGIATALGRIEKHTEAPKPSLHVIYA